MLVTLGVTCIFGRLEIWVFKNWKNDRIEEVELSPHYTAPLICALR